MEYRLFADLTRDEANALLDQYVGGLSDRAQDLIARARRDGGPAERLDFSRSSMRPLWTWFVTAHRLPAAPVSDQAMRAADPSWWYEFHPPFGQQLGPELSTLVTDLAAYLAMCVVRQRPDASFVLGVDKRGADYRMPVLRVGPVDRTVDQILITTAIKALQGDPDRSDPGRLEQMFDQWVGHPKVG